MNIRVIINFKFKHINANVKYKKKDMVVDVDIRRYNMGSQNLEESKGFVLKNVEVGEGFFRDKIGRVMEKEMERIREVFKMSK